MLDKEHIDKLTARLPEIEAQFGDPQVTANRKKFQELVREHAHLKKLSQSAELYWRTQIELEEHNAMIHGEETEDELKELAREEIPELEKIMKNAKRDLMNSLVPPDPTDERNTIMEIRAGTGGDEAALFAGDLFRMYNRYAEEHGWKIGLIDASPCEVGGFKEVVFAVEGKAVYGQMKYESGVHRVQRVPVTESQGRIHTSAATVAVFPEAEEADVTINSEDLRIDRYCSSGPGGQSVNTTQSAVRITHLPTKIVAQSQDEKSQHRNKDRAMAVLRARLLDYTRAQEEERMGNARRSQVGSGDRSERIRTYNFPQNRLTDHRIGLTIYSLDRVVDGQIDELIAALRDHDIQLKLEQGLKNQVTNTTGQ